MQVLNLKSLINFRIPIGHKNILKIFFGNLSYFQFIFTVFVPFPGGKVPDCQVPDWIFGCKVSIDYRQAWGAEADERILGKNSRNFPKIWNIFFWKTFLINSEKFPDNSAGSTSTLACWTVWQSISGCVRVEFVWIQVYIRSTILRLTRFTLPGNSSAFTSDLLGQKGKAAA